MRKNSWIWGKITDNMSSTKALLSLSSALPSRIWFLALHLDFGVPCQRQCLNPHVPRGSSWHPGSRACLLERHELILLSCPHNGILIAAEQFASSYTEMTLTDIQGTAPHCQGLQVQFPALQDPGCTFNHYQLLLPWMLFLTECFRMWDLIRSSSAVIQSGRKANKSLLLIGFQLSSNQFVLQNAGHIFNYCTLPDTREMEGFLLVLWHLCWKVLQQLCKGRKNDGVTCRTSDDAKESNSEE